MRGVYGVVIPARYPESARSTIPITQPGLAKSRINGMSALGALPTTRHDRAGHYDGHGLGLSVVAVATLGSTRRHDGYIGDRTWRAWPS
jgi:hypothetical protein